MTCLCCQILSWHVGFVWLPRLFPYFCGYSYLIMAAIAYFSEQIPFRFPDKRRVSTWIRGTIVSEGCVLSQLNIVFCSDEYLLQINREYLQHDYFTDIITFNQSDFPQCIEGDIFISIDRVRENAAIYSVPFLHELHRIIIHGVLHLAGYTDHTDEKRREMREKESFYLTLLTTI